MTNKACLTIHSDFVHNNLFLKSYLFQVQNNWHSQDCQKSVKNKHRLLRCQFQSLTVNQHQVHGGQHRLKVHRSGWQASSRKPRSQRTTSPNIHPVREQGSITNPPFIRSTEHHRQCHPVG